MKRIMFFTLILAFPIFGFAQINRYSNKPRPADVSSSNVDLNYGLINRALKTRQAQYNNNLRYANKLLDWIYDLKKQTDDAIFNRSADKRIRELKSLKEKDLSQLSDELISIKKDITNAIEIHNRRVETSEKNNKYQQQNCKEGEVLINLSMSAQIKDKPSGAGKLLLLANANTNLRIIGFKDGYWKVKVGSIQGYVMEDLYFKTTPQLLSIKNNKKQNIVGDWVVESVLVYSNGKESNVAVNKNHNILVGSNENRKHYIFTEYGEVFFDTYWKKSYFNRVVSSYKIVEDQVVLGSNTKWEMIELTSNRLILRQELKINYFDKTKYHAKTFHTFYLRKYN